MGYGYAMSMTMNDDDARGSSYLKKLRKSSNWVGPDSALVPVRDTTTAPVCTGMCNSRGLHLPL